LIRIIFSFLVLGTAIFYGVLHTQNISAYEPIIELLIEEKINMTGNDSKSDAIINEVINSNNKLHIISESINNNVDVISHIIPSSERIQEPIPINNIISIKIITDSTLTNDSLNTVTELIKLFPENKQSVFQEFTNFIKRQFAKDNDYKEIKNINSKTSEINESHLDDINNHISGNTNGISTDSQNQVSYCNSLGIKNDLSIMGFMLIPFVFRKFANIRK